MREPYWNFSPALPLFRMTENYSIRPARILTPEQRKARAAERQADAEQALRERDVAQKAFDKNRERLRAERLAREGQASNN